MNDLKLTDYLFNNNLNDDFIKTEEEINNKENIKKFQNFYSNGYVSFEYSNYYDKNYSFFANTDNTINPILYDENDISYYNYFMIDNSNYYTAVIWYYVKMILSYILLAIIFYLLVKLIKIIFRKFGSDLNFSSITNMKSVLDDIKKNAANQNIDKTALLKKIAAYVILIIILLYSTYFLIL